MGRVACASVCFNHDPTPHCGRVHPIRLADAGVLASKAYTLGTVFLGAVMKFMFDVEAHSTFRGAVLNYLNNSRGYPVPLANVIIVSLNDVSAGRRMAKGRGLSTAGVNVSYAVLSSSLGDAGTVADQLK